MAALLAHSFHLAPNSAPNISEIHLRSTPRMDMPVDKVREILKIAQEPVSLETPIGEEEDSHLGDFIPDEGASEPIEAKALRKLRHPSRSKKLKDFLN